MRFQAIRFTLPFPLKRWLNAEIRETHKIMTVPECLELSAFSFER
jgi:hypothetical protein